MKVANIKEENLIAHFIATHPGTQNPDEPQLSPKRGFFMRRANLTWLISLLVAALFILPACDDIADTIAGSGGSATALRGSWKVVEASPRSLDVGSLITFNADGTGTWAVLPIAWTYAENSTILTVATGGRTQKMTLAWTFGKKYGLPTMTTEAGLSR